MRERLKAEAGGATLAWIAQGARLWLATGTNSPESVQSLTADHLCEQDLIGQWLGERCERKADTVERSSDLHRNYTTWCDTQGTRPKSNMALSAHLVSAGFAKGSTMIGRVFHGLKLKGL